MVTNRRKLFAVDPSLRSTGWVLFDLVAETPIDCGLVGNGDTSLPLSIRLSQLQRDIEHTLREVKLKPGDILVCEGPAPLVLNPQSALKVEHIRGIFETLARIKGVDVPGRINPRTLQTELLGLRGRQIARTEVKRAARQVALRLYGEFFAAYQENARKKCVSQDIIDAALIGALAVSKLNMCCKLGCEISDAFAEGTRSFKRGGRKGIRWKEVDVKKYKNS